MRKKKERERDGEMEGKEREREGGEREEKMVRIKPPHMNRWSMDGSLEGINE